ncbi:MAG: hypothetical protein ABW201_02870 [Candidatus Thiodiazotropha sp.]
MGGTLCDETQNRPDFYGQPGTVSRTGSAGFSGFEPIARFGMLSALVIVAAYFSNLAIMPGLLLMRTPGKYAEAWLYAIVRTICGLLLRKLAENPQINANDY